MKAKEIKNATIESILKGYHKVQDTVMVTLTTMKKYAEKFLCEDLLNPDVSCFLYLLKWHPRPRALFPSDRAEKVRSPGNEDAKMDVLNN